MAIVRKRAEGLPQPGQKTKRRLHGSHGPCSLFAFHEDAIVLFAQSAIAPG